MGIPLIKIIQFGFVLIFLITGTAAFAEDYPGKATDWNGFDKHSFKVESRNAYVVVPEEAAAGTPWVWRARFPDWHPEADLILLERGFHIAYIDVANMYGSKRAVEKWDAFYTYVTDNFGFAEKMAIEGASRGGLISYHWAGQNPDKVACIYLESPVCDATSWPGGKGNGKGSDADWKRLLKEYGAAEGEMPELSYRPLKQLEALAKHNVPILHLVDAADTIVPVAENTTIIMNRYRELGGQMAVTFNTAEPRNLEGHHFPFAHPEDAADFIEHFAAIEKNTSLTDTPYGYEYFKLRRGLKNVQKLCKDGEDVRVAFLGGSITQNPGWRNKVMDYLEERYPDVNFDAVYAGISSMGSTPGAFRFKRDVLKNGKVDLLFSEAAVNDSTNFRSPEQFIRGVEGIVRQALASNPAMDIVLMHFVDPGKMKHYETAEVPVVIQKHDQVAQHYQITSLNLAREVTERIRAGEFSWEKDFKDLHPSPFGQDIYAKSMIRMLEAAWAGASEKVQAHELPNAPIDEFSYSKAALYSIQDADELKGFNYHKKWNAPKGVGTRAGFTGVPMLIGEHPDNSLSFAFTGRAVGLWVAAGPDAGIIEYRIDNGDWQELDLFTPWSSGLHLPWAYILAEKLEHGNHYVDIRILDNKNEKSKGHAVRIVNFLVNE